MKFKLKYLLPVIFLIFCFLLIPSSAVIWSTSNEFNVTPNTLYVNWTNSSGIGLYAENITLGNYNKSINIILNITNSSTYTNITNSTGSRAPFSVYGWNGTNYIYSNQINVSNLTTQKVSLFFDTTGLAPGRYSGNLTILNSTNATENITNLTVILDVPIDVSTGTGTFAGNVSNSSEIYYFNTSAIANVAGFRINLTDMSATEVVNAALYDSSGSSMNSTGSGNLTWHNTTTNPTFPIPSAYWYISISNSTGNATFNGAIELLKPSLRANNTFSSSSVTIKENRGYNFTRVLNITFNNTADYNLTFYNVLNSTNLTHETSSTKYINFTFGTLGTQLDNNTNSLINIAIPITMVGTQNTSGLYRGWIYINSTNGYPYKTFNLSLIVNLTHDLDVNVSAVEKSGGGTPTPGNAINITVAPKYQNGSFVPNLNLSTSNFIFWAEYLNSSSLSNATLGNLTATNNLLAFSSVAGEANYYNLTVTLGSAVLGGNYTLYVYTRDNNTNNLNYGTGSKSFTVSGTALKLELLGGTATYGNDTIAIPGTSYSPANLSLGSYYYIRPKVWNYGSTPATNVNVSYSGCSGYLSQPTPAALSIGTVNAWGYGENTSAQHWAFNATTAGTCAMTIYTVATGTQYYDRQNITINFAITPATTTTTTGGTTGTGAAAATTNTTTALSITDYPTEIKIKQNASAIKSIKVKNTGAVALTSVSVSVSGINESWLAEPSAQDIAKNVEKTYNIAFSIPGDAEVKSYPITFKAAATGISKTVTSNLIVLPSAETVNQTILPEFENLTAWYTNVSLLFNKTKVAGGNVSLVEAKLNETRDLLDNASAYIDEGEYYSAYQLFAQIKNLLNTTETDLIAIKEGLGKGIALPWTWIGIVVAVIACVIIIIYVALPRMGKLKIGFKPKAVKPEALKPEALKGKASIIEKIKEKINKLKEKLKRKKEAKYEGEPWIGG